MSQPSSPSFELWTGPECTVNRVGDRYFDQLHRTGHHDRLHDLSLLAGLGASAVRYPVLWERTAPEGVCDFSWADGRLLELRELGVRPIVGLVHHGSGPRSTSLVDPGFPDALARYAGQVAERYPWVSDWTPVNEPLTTARFSCLYGHWYPHAREPRVFAVALLNQCLATLRAMRAIRKVIPGARLVQTEDLGQTRATEPLAYQAAFENERRWLTWDLLAGRVVTGHPLWWYLAGLGRTVRLLLDQVAEEACPADVLGINYYVTSERFLDHRLERYPLALHGGNGRHAYADVEAVRVCEPGLVGAGALLLAAWARYQRPLALTEVHLGCDEVEQCRWFLAAWRGCELAQAGGAQVEGITAWSAFGSFDWHNLVTRFEGHYEAGPFDVRGPAPRPTMLAELLRDRCQTLTPELTMPGWWERPERLLHGRREELGA